MNLIKTFNKRILNKCFELILTNKYEFNYVYIKIIFNFIIYIAYNYYHNNIYNY